MTHICGPQCSSFNHNCPRNPCKDASAFDYLPADLNRHICDLLPHPDQESFACQSRTVERDVRPIFDLQKVRWNRLKAKISALKERIFALKETVIAFCKEEAPVAGGVMIGGATTLGGAVLLSNHLEGAVSAFPFTACGMLGAVINDNIVDLPLPQSARMYLIFAIFSLLTLLAAKLCDSYDITPSLKASLGMPGEYYAVELVALSGLNTLLGTLSGNKAAARDASGKVRTGVVLGSLLGCIINGLSFLADRL